MKRLSLLLAAALAVTGMTSPGWATTPIETPMLAADVDAGKLPPVAERLPDPPLVEPMSRPWQKIGQHGGDLITLMGRQKDIRLMTVYGYARLIGYDADLNLVPDIAEKIEVEDNKVFTFHLRKNHRWSDGHPFTSEDFRYYWEDIINDAELTPFGPSPEFLVNGEKPTVEILGPTTIRYSWTNPNPYFLIALAGASPTYIYGPAHYLRQFHAKYADAAELQKKVEAASAQNWAALHTRMDHPYRFDNVDRPTLQPWMNTTPSPADRFVFVRNSYYHRIDPEGRQLPYIDRIIINISDGSLIPAKTGLGESDLQGRDIRFEDYTFLKEGEKTQNFNVALWRPIKGSQVALHPNLNAADPMWRELLRDARFRRALSLGIDREEINQAIYFGLGQTGNNTILPDSKLFRDDYLTSWAVFDTDKANQLLDEMGLDKRDGEGIRLLPNGKPLDLIVETSGESTEETDVLELIRDTWAAIGIRMFTKPSQREVFRNRVFAGDTVMSVWSGLTNGAPTADMPPNELAPTAQIQLQWPKWGQYVETKQQVGEPVDMPVVQELANLLSEWEQTASTARRAEIWQRMLEIHAEQQFTIGTVRGIFQPVVVNKELRNIPAEGIWNWDPGAFFGMYRMDAFWFTEARRTGGR